MVFSTPGILGKLLEFLENSWNSWRTPGIPGKLWNFEIFFQVPGKLVEKQKIFMYSWKTPKMLWKNFHQFYKQTKTCIINFLTHDCTYFIFYYQSVNTMSFVWEGFL